MVKAILSMNFKDINKTYVRTQHKKIAIHCVQHKLNNIIERIKNKYYYYFLI